VLDTLRTSNALIDDYARLCDFLVNDETFAARMDMKQTALLKSCQSLMKEEEETMHSDSYEEGILLLT
jgi:hypothetical protein